MNKEQFKEYHRIPERPITAADLKEVTDLYQDSPLSLIDLARKVKRQPITVLHMLAAKGNIENVKQPIQGAVKPRPSTHLKGTTTCGN